MSIADNLIAVEDRIAAACQRVGRRRDEVRLLPVSKTKPAAAVVEAHTAGYRRFGENKVQEAHGKWEELHEEYPDIEWAVIGHLQTNKAKLVARFATEFQALDNEGQARELNKRLEAEGRTLDVLVQVNTSAEPQKFGIEPAEAVAFTRGLNSYERLRVRGLMTLAVFSPDEAAVGACFDRLVAVQHQLRDVDGGGWDELSMGMSGDFELAIEHGATCVRVGQAIFGSRGDTADDWWPGIAS